MKKLILLLLLTAVPALGLTVDVNGSTLPADPPTRLEGGRVSVPLRAIFQALGAEVNYQDGLIEASKGANQIALRTGTRSALINGKAVQLDAPARVHAGVTYVPLRFVAQALGERVAWDGAAQKVSIGAGGAMAGVLPDLSRLAVGNQAGVLKVWNAGKTQVAYFRGIDDRSVAPLSGQDQQGILQALGLDGNLDPVARALMNGKSRKESLALLGVLNSLDGTDRISGGTARQIRSYLSRTMVADKSPINRRQAVLALAVGNGLEDSVTDSVLRFYSGSDNLWETFPVQQFFEYQSARLSRSARYPQWKQQALAVNSLYRENIASYLP